MGKKEDGRKERGIVMTQSLWRAVRVQSALEDRGASSLIRQAVEEYLERHRGGRRQQGAEK